MINSICWILLLFLALPLSAARANFTTEDGACFGEMAGAWVAIAFGTMAWDNASGGYGLSLVVLDIALTIAGILAFFAYHEAGKRLEAIRVRSSPIV